MVNESYPVYKWELFNVSCDPLNETCFDCVLNMTVQPCKSVNRSVFDHYDYHMVNESYWAEENVSDLCWILGIILTKDKEGEKPKFYSGIFNVYNDTVYKFDPPQMCRNWNEYYGCRDFELKKKVCSSWKKV